MARTQKLLVRGVNWLGDAVMTTPAMQRLREHLPQAHITILTHEKLTDLWRGHPTVDDVTTYAKGEGPWAIARRLRNEHFDAALVFPNSPRSALESWLARIPRRIGYAHPWRNWLLTEAVPTRPGHVQMHKRTIREIKRLIAEHGAPRLASTTGHQINEYLHLVSTAFGANAAPVAPQIRISEVETQAAREKFKLPADRPVFAVNPGAEYGPGKRWPAKRFIAAMQQIQQQTTCAWVIVGGPGDVPIATEIHSAFRSSQGTINLGGQTSLRELMAVLKFSRVLLTNDSGPMHLAAALGTRVVVPFGSTSPELTGPGLPGDSHHHLLSASAPCSPCFLRTCPIDFRCMNNISVESVVGAIQKTMGV
jgi:heptosyltransferase-2